MKTNFSFASLPNNASHGSTANPLVDNGNACAMQCEEHLEEHFSLFGLLEYKSEFESQFIDEKRS